MNNSNNFSVSPMPTIDEEVKDEQGTPAQQLFFRQIHAMITNESSSGCIKWLSDNRGFVISGRDSFSDKILPRYFGKAKYSSFTRRLKRWGFRRVTKGADGGAYYHDTFHKDMDFEAYEDMEGDISECSPSEQSLPPKKRKSWSPVPGNLKLASGSSNSMCSGNADVHAMPKIMREINRSKRFKTDDFHPNVKRAQLGQSPFCNEGVTSFNSSSMNHSYMPDKRIGCDNRGFAAFGHITDQDYSREHNMAHQNQLARLKRQVFEQNQGIDFGLGYSYSQSRTTAGNSMDFLNPARRDLSQLSTEILQREIALHSFIEDNSYARGRQMQGVPYTVDSSQMRRQVVNTTSTPSMNFRFHDNDRGRTNEYCSHALGALNESAGHMDPSIHQSKCSSPNVNTSIKEKKGHYRLDSVNIPIPGVKDMEPTKNPFNRAA